MERKIPIGNQDPILELNEAQEDDDDATERGDGDTAMGLRPPIMEMSASRRELIELDGDDTDENETPIPIAVPPVSAANAAQYAARRSLQALPADIEFDENDRVIVTDLTPEDIQAARKKKRNEDAAAKRELTKRRHLLMSEEEIKAEKEKDKLLWQTYGKGKVYNKYSAEKLAGRGAQFDPEKFLAESKAGSAKSPTAPKRKLGQDKSRSPGSAAKKKGRGDDAYRQTLRTEEEKEFYDDTVRQYNREQAAKKRKATETLTPEQQRERQQKLMEAMRAKLGGLKGVEKERTEKLLSALDRGGIDAYHTERKRQKEEKARARDEREQKKRQKEQEAANRKQERQKKLEEQKQATRLRKQAIAEQKKAEFDALPEEKKQELRDAKRQQRAAARDAKISEMGEAKWAALQAERRKKMNLRRREKESMLGILPSTATKEDGVVVTLSNGQSAVLRRGMNAAEIEAAIQELERKIQHPIGQPDDYGLEEDDQDEDVIVEEIEELEPIEIESDDDQSDNGEPTKKPRPVWTDDDVVPEVDVPMTASQLPAEMQLKMTRAKSRKKPQVGLTEVESSRPAASAVNPAPQPPASTVKPAPQPPASTVKPAPQPPASTVKPAPQPPASTVKPAPQPPASTVKPAPQPPASTVKPAPRPAVVSIDPADVPDGSRVTAVTNSRVSGRQEPNSVAAERKKDRDLDRLGTTRVPRRVPTRSRTPTELDPTEDGMQDQLPPSEVEMDDIDPFGAGEQTDKVTAREEVEMEEDDPFGAGEQKGAAAAREEVEMEEDDPFGAGEQKGAVAVQEEVQAIERDPFDAAEQKEEVQVIERDPFDADEQKEEVQVIERDPFDGAEQKGTIATGTDAQRVSERDEDRDRDRNQNQDENRRRRRSRSPDRPPGGVPPVPPRQPPGDVPPPPSPPRQPPGGAPPPPPPPPPPPAPINVPIADPYVRIRQKINQTNQAAGQPPIPDNAPLDVILDHMETHRLMIANERAWLSACKERLGVQRGNVQETRNLLLEGVNTMLLVSGLSMAIRQLATLEGTDKLNAPVEDVHNVPVFFSRPDARFDNIVKRTVDGCLQMQPSEAFKPNEFIEQRSSVQLLLATILYARSSLCLFDESNARVISEMPRGFVDSAQVMADAYKREIRLAAASRAITSVELLSSRALDPAISYGGYHSGLIQATIASNAVLRSTATDVIQDRRRQLGLPTAINNHSEALKNVWTDMKDTVSQYRAAAVAARSVVDGICTTIEDTRRTYPYKAEEVKFALPEVPIERNQLPIWIHSCEFLVTDLSDFIQSQLEYVNDMHAAVAASMQVHSIPADKLNTPHPAYLEMLDESFGELRNAQNANPIAARIAEMIRDNSDEKVGSSREDLRKAIDKLLLNAEETDQLRNRLAQLSSVSDALVKLQVDPKDMVPFLNELSGNRTKYTVASLVDSVRRRHAIVAYGQLCAVMHRELLVNFGHTLLKIKSMFTDIVNAVNEFVVSRGDEFLQQQLASIRASMNALLGPDNAYAVMEGQIVTQEDQQAAAGQAIYVYDGKERSVLPMFVNHEAVLKLATSAFVRQAENRHGVSVFERNPDGTGIPALFDSLMASVNRWSEYTVAISDNLVHSDKPNLESQQYTTVISSAVNQLTELSKQMLRSASDNSNKIQEVFQKLNTTVVNEASRLRRNVDMRLAEVVRKHYVFFLYNLTRDNFERPDLLSLQLPVGASFTRGQVQALMNDLMVAFAVPSEEKSMFLGVQRTLEVEIPNLHSANTVLKAQYQVQESERRKMEARSGQLITAYQRLDSAVRNAITTMNAYLGELASQDNAEVAATIASFRQDQDINPDIQAAFAADMVGTISVRPIERLTAAFVKMTSTLVRNRLQNRGQDTETQRKLVTAARNAALAMARHISEGKQRLVTPALVAEGAGDVDQIINRQGWDNVIDAITRVLGFSEQVALAYRRTKDAERAVQRQMATGFARTYNKLAADHPVGRDRINVQEVIEYENRPEQGMDQDEQRAWAPLVQNLQNLFEYATLIAHDCKTLSQDQTTIRNQMVLDLNRALQQITNNMQGDAAARALEEARLREQIADPIGMQAQNAEGIWREVRMNNTRLYQFAVDMSTRINRYLAESRRQIGPIQQQLQAQELGGEVPIEAIAINNLDHAAAIQQVMVRIVRERLTVVDRFLQGVRPAFRRIQPQVVENLGAAGDNEVELANLGFNNLNDVTAGVNALVSILDRKNRLSQELLQAVRQAMRTLAPDVVDNLGMQQDNDGAIANLGVNNTNDVIASVNTLVRLLDRKNRSIREFLQGIRANVDPMRAALMQNLPADGPVEIDMAMRDLASAGALLNAILRLCREKSESIRRYIDAATQRKARFMDTIRRVDPTMARAAMVDGTLRIETLDALAAAENPMYGQLETFVQERKQSLDGLVAAVREIDEVVARIDRTRADRMAVDDRERVDLAAIRANVGNEDFRSALEAMRFYGRYLGRNLAKQEDFIRKFQEKISGISQQLTRIDPDASAIATEAVNAYDLQSLIIIVNLIEASVTRVGNDQRRFIEVFDGELAKLIGTMSEVGADARDGLNAELVIPDVSQVSTLTSAGRRSVVVFRRLIDAIRTLRKLREKYDELFDKSKGLDFKQKLIGELNRALGLNRKGKGGDSGPSVVLDPGAILDMGTSTPANGSGADAGNGFNLADLLLGNGPGKSGKKGSKGSLRLTSLFGGSGSRENARDGPDLQSHFTINMFLTENDTVRVIPKVTVNQRDRRFRPSYEQVYLFAMMVAGTTSGYKVSSLLTQKVPGLVIPSTHFDIMLEYIRRMREEMGGDVNAMIEQMLDTSNRRWTAFWSELEEGPALANGDQRIDNHADLSPIEEDAEDRLPQEEAVEDAVRGRRGQVRNVNERRRANGSSVSDEQLDNALGRGDTARRVDMGPDVLPGERKVREQKNPDGQDIEDQDNSGRRGILKRGLDVDTQEDYDMNEPAREKLRIRRGRRSIEAQPVFQDDKYSRITREVVNQLVTSIAPSQPLTVLTTQRIVNSTRRMWAEAVRQFLRWIAPLEACRTPREFDDLLLNYFTPTIAAKMLLIKNTLSKRPRYQDLTVYELMFTERLQVDFATAVGRQLNMNDATALNSLTSGASLQHHMTSAAVIGNVLENGWVRRGLYDWTSVPLTQPEPIIIHR